MRLFTRDNLPKLLGSERFTKQVLRFAWHLTTLAWWGFAAVLIVLSNSSANIYTQIYMIVATVFALSGIFALVLTRGQHFSWIVFFIISAITYASSYN